MSQVKKTSNFTYPHTKAIEVDVNINWLKMKNSYQLFDSTVKKKDTVFLISLQRQSIWRDHVVSDDVSEVFRSLAEVHVNAVYRQTSPKQSHKAPTSFGCQMCL